MNKRIYIIGIDPGTITGFAIWDAHNKRFADIFSCGIIEAIYYLKALNKGEIFVRIEDARKRKWFGANSNSKQQGAGSIKRDCSIWEELMELENIAHEFTSPGKIKTKLKSEEFKRLTGWTSPTNEHARDAAMLVFGSPIRKT